MGDWSAQRSLLISVRCQTDQLLTEIFSAYFCHVRFKRIWISVVFLLDYDFQRILLFFYGL